MNLPGFTAQVSLYRTGGRYHTTSAHHGINAVVHPAAVNEVCYEECYGSWQDAQYCRDRCCEQVVDCGPDPAYPNDPSCQVCYKDNCPGPGGVMWTTCQNPPPDEPLQAPCYLDGWETSCDYVNWCKKIGLCE